MRLIALLLLSAAPVWAADHPATSKKFTSRPLTPSRITSATGAVSEATTSAPADIDSSIDHDSTKG